VSRYRIKSGAPLVILIPVESLSRKTAKGSQNARQSGQKLYSGEPWQDDFCLSVTPLIDVNRLCGSISAVCRPVRVNK